MPKAVPNSQEPLALSAVGSSMPTLARFDPAERSSALEHQDAMRLRMNKSCRGVVPLVLIAALVACGVPSLSKFAGRSARKAGPRRGRRRRRWRDRRRRQSRPNADGFIQRWLVLEPIRVPGQLTESAVRTAVEKDFPVPATPLPRDGDTVKVGDSEARVARGRHAQLQRQPLSFRLRAEQADDATCSSGPSPSSTRRAR